MTPKKNKLRKILGILSPDGTQVDFAEFDKEVETLKGKLKDKIQVQTLEDVNNQLDRFRKRISLQPLVDSVEKIRSSIDEQLKTIASEIETKTSELNVTINDRDSGSKERSTNLQLEISDLKLQLSTLEETRKVDLEKIRQSIPDLSDLESRLSEMTLELSSRVDVLESVEPQEIKDWQEDIDKLRRELFNRLGSINTGGNMNRQITVANVDPLTKYTDINLKAGSNMTITTSVNEATKRVDITFASSGGGGSVVGTSRSITTLTVSSTIGTTSGVDQVYLANGGIQITLPTAVGDTNLYTIKNVGTSSVLINTQNAETIDNDSTIIMPIRYTSVDIISDSVNWNVT